MKANALRSAGRAMYIIATILLSAFLAYAQTGPPSTTEQKPALGTAPVAPNRYQPDTGAYGQVGIEGLSDTQGVDIRPYVFLDVLPHINDKWHELFPQVTSPPVMKKGKVAIEFAIANDGSVHSMRMIKSSNDAALDFGAWAAIAASNPFPPLSAELKGEDLAFRLSFDYNPDPRDIALTPPINDILRKHHENLSNDKNARVDLENDVRALSSVLNNGHLETKNEIAVRFYRGTAIRYLGALWVDQGQPVDLDMAKEALLDFDRVIDSNTEVAGWENTRTEATFEAGQIAHQIRSTTLAYSYWSKCAHEGHVGCVMRVATAHVTGEGGITVDFGKALDLYRKAFDANAGYQCAGAHSALSIAWGIRSKANAIPV